MKTRIFFAAIFTALAVGACSSGQARRASADGPTVLEVQNNANLDMNIFVFARGGNRNRLGTATAHQTSHFTIPQRLIFGLTPMQFQADPIGTGARPVTEEITVQPGDTVVFLIPPGD